MIFNLIKYYLSNAIYVLKTPVFWYIRLCFFIFYFGKRPFQTVKKQTQGSASQALTYGETPYAVWELIGHFLKPNDRFMDLGSGRGLGLFFLACQIPARFLGIECVHDFVARGSKIADTCGISNIQFMHKDLHSFKLPKCDIVYLAGTCFDDELLEKICLSLSEIKPRHIFSISTDLREYNLCGYDIQEKQINMPWGKTSLYILTLS